MNDRKKILIVKQLDVKLTQFKEVSEIIVPPFGWIKSIRTALNMSLRQLAKRMKITAQSISEMEKREISGTITLNTLKDLARALDMQFVYGFVPKNGSIEQMIEQRAEEIAREIIGRTDVTMTLENQQNSKERINMAIGEKIKEIKYEIPKYLWD